MMKSIHLNYLLTNVHMTPLSILFLNCF